MLAVVQRSNWENSWLWPVCCQHCSCLWPFTAACSSLKGEMDESKLELTPYFYSTKVRVIEAHPGDAGDAGINQHCCIFCQRESVNGATVTAAMQQFFEWLRADGALLLTVPSSWMVPPPILWMPLRLECPTAWVRLGEICCTSPASWHTPQTSTDWTSLPETHCGRLFMVLNGCTTCAS